MLQSHDLFGFRRQPAPFASDTRRAWLTNRRIFDAGCRNGWQEWRSEVCSFRFWGARSEVSIKRQRAQDRAVIDHVGEKIARLDLLMQKAQNTLRALQREREATGRIKQGIKALRADSGGGGKVVTT